MKKLKWIIGIFSLSVIAWSFATTFFFKEKIEKDLTAKALMKLKQARFQKVAASFDGRDGTFTGQMFENETRRLEEVINGLDESRVIHNKVKRVPANAGFAKCPPNKPCEPKVEKIVEVKRIDKVEKVLEQLIFHFPYNSSTPLDSDLKEKLSQFVQGQQSQGSFYRIKGHADARGKDAYNLNLGGRRAIEIMNLLVSLGVNPEGIEMISLGERHPSSVGRTEADYQANRRVVIEKVIYQ